MSSVNLETVAVPVRESDRFVLGINANNLEIQRVTASICSKFKTDTLSPGKLNQVVETLLSEEIRMGSDALKARQKLEGYLEKIELANKTTGFEKIISSIAQILNDQSNRAVVTQQFGVSGCRFAMDLLHEISDPGHNIHQGDSYACAVTAEQFIKKDSVSYAKCMADLFTKGAGFTRTDASGISYGLIELTPDLLGNFALKGRETIPMALYQDALLLKFGMPEGGLYPADCERFLEARGVPSKLITSDNKISSSPDSLEEISKNIQRCASQGQNALLSLECGTAENRMKHMFELCSSEGVPAGYLKISNPKNNLTESMERLVSHQSDGTMLIKIDDLMKHLYFAVVETDNLSDYGSTSGVREVANPSKIYPGVELTFFARPDPRKSDYERNREKLEKTEAPQTRESPIKVLSDPESAVRQPVASQNEQDQGRRYFTELASRANVKNVA